MKLSSKTSVEVIVEEMQRRTGMKSNNIDWHILENAADSIIEEVEKYDFLTRGELDDILDKHTTQFKNPEFSAVRTYSIQNLMLLGYSINQYQISK